MIVIMNNVELYNEISAWLKDTIKVTKNVYVLGSLPCPW